MVAQVDDDHEDRLVVVLEVRDGAFLVYCVNGEALAADLEHHQIAERSL